MTGARGFGWRDAVLALAVALFVGLWGTRAHEAAKTAHDDGRFVGILADSLHVSMGAVYGAFVRETMDAPSRPTGVAGGSGLFVHNEQTTAKHEGQLLRPWEHALGLIARAVQPADPATFVFHLERWLAVFVFVFGVAWLGAELLSRFALRSLFLVLATLGGNLYSVVVTSGSAAGARHWLNSYLPNLSGLGFSYPSYLLGVPHLAMEIGCVAIGVAGILMALRAPRGRAAVLGACLGGLGILGLAAIRPYTAPVLFAVAALGLVRLVVQGRTVGEALLLGACLLAPATPMLAFDALALGSDSIFAALDVTHPSPPLFEQLLFLGAPLVLAVFLLPFTWRRLERTLALALGLWIVLGTLLSNGAPLIAWEVEALSPLVLAWLALFVLALEALVDRGRRSWAIGVGAVALGLGLHSTALRLGELDDHLAARDRFLWMSDAEAEAVDWLRDQRQPGGLSRDVPMPGVWVEPRPLAALIPWLTGTRVFLGHPDHTPESGRKLAFSERVAKNGEGLNLLKDAGVTHLISWPQDGPDPFLGAPSLRRIHSGNVEIDLLRGTNERKGD